MGEGRGGVEVPLEWESWPPALPSSGGAARYSLAGGRQREAGGGRGRQGNQMSTRPELNPFDLFFFRAELKAFNQCESCGNAANRITAATVA